MSRLLVVMVVAVCMLGATGRAAVTPLTFTLGPGCTITRAGFPGGGACEHFRFGSTIELLAWGGFYHQSDGALVVLGDGWMGDLHISSGLPNLAGTGPRFDLMEVTLALGSGHGFPGPVELRSSAGGRAVIQPERDPLGQCRRSVVTRKLPSRPQWRGLTWIRFSVTGAWRPSLNCVGLGSTSYTVRGLTINDGK